MGRVSGVIGVKPPRPPPMPSRITAPRPPQPTPPRVPLRPPALDPPPVPNRVADAAGDVPSVSVAQAGDVRVRPPPTGAKPPVNIRGRVANFRRTYPRLFAAGVTAGGVAVYAVASGQSFDEAASDLGSRTVDEAAGMVGDVVGGPIGSAAADAATDIAEAFGIDFAQVWYYMKIVGAGAAVGGGLWVIATVRTATGA